ncbi:MAG: ornithine carbamoyltransferase [Thermodesulfovibrio sp.]|nr:ornithine carbamoyltransferase [Thermodesulfovibrio sp.]
MKRDFLTIWDLSRIEIEGMLRRAIDLKSGVDSNKCPLIGKSIGLFFEKPSTRTRVSFEVGIYQLGGQAIYLSPKEIQLGRGETIADTARVLSGYLSGIILRTYSHSSIEEFAMHSTIPVINGLSDLHHPCQAIADLMTILEKKRRLKDIRLAYIGDGNNVANSLIGAAARTGIEMVIACPKGFEPNQDVLKRAGNKEDAENAGEIIIVRDPKEAASRADVIYTDVWVSMGQEKEAGKKKAKFKNYQINKQLLQYAKKDVIVLHCLPAYRGQEITDDIMDGPNSAIFNQSENRLHTGKALLEFLL